MSFEKRFNEFIPELTTALSTPDSSDWSVKGFIDCYKNIYSISTDTKVVSKIIELMIFPKFLQFARDNGLTLKLAPHQNYYPDITFIDSDGLKYAVDLKSTYRVNPTTVNGMTLGAFTGYFRNRTSSKNILFPYNEYTKHYVFGIIYSRTDIDLIEKYIIEEKKIFPQLPNATKKVLLEYVNIDEDIDDIKWNEFTNSCNQQFNIPKHMKATIDNYKQIRFKDICRQNGYELPRITKSIKDMLDEYKINKSKDNKQKFINFGEEHEIANIEVFLSAIDALCDENSYINQMEEYLLQNNYIFPLSEDIRCKLVSYINESNYSNWDEFINDYQGQGILAIEDKVNIDSILRNDETASYSLDNFNEIQSVVKNFEFFLQEKWKIAIDRPGSGNTKNIGSETSIATLKNGNGKFYQEYGASGKDIFDRFWMNFQNNDMAKSAGQNSPSYTNIATYKTWVSSLQS